MSRHEQLSVGELTLGKGGAKVGGKTVAGGAESLNITTKEAVATSACVADSRVKITVNGVEYYLPLLAV
jgi:hypothetical protein